MYCKQERESSGGRSSPLKEVRGVQSDTDALDEECSPSDLLFCVFSIKPFWRKAFKSLSSRILLRTYIIAISKQVNKFRRLIWRKFPSDFFDYRRAQRLSPELRSTKWKPPGDCSVVTLLDLMVRHLRFDHEILMVSLKCSGGYLAHRWTVSDPISLIDLLSGRQFVSRRPGALKKSHRAPF